jgi:hypothetical protein
MAEEKYLTKEDIINCNDLAMESVKVKEWGGIIFVKELSVAERIEFETSLKEKKEDDILGRMLLFLSFTICDKERNHLFETSDIESLYKKNIKVILKLFRIANKLSALTVESEEELRKNSETGPVA